MPVSKKERAQAHRQSRVTAAFERKSIEAASRLGFRMMSRSLSAFKANRLLEIPLIVAEEYAEAKVVLIEMMVLGYLTGLDRLREGKKKTLTAALHTEALRNLFGRLQIDDDKLEEITGRFNTQATRVMNRSSEGVEKSLQRSIIKSTEEGLTTREGTKLLRDTFAKNGIVPTNSYEYEAIFRTQTQMAYGAGTWDAAHDPAVDDILWGYKYVTVGDDRVRPEHVVLDGTTAPKDNSIWNTIWPPNGWACRCQVIFLFEPETISMPQAKEIDGTVVEPVPDNGFDFNPGTKFNPGNNSVRKGNAIGDGIVRKTKPLRKTTPKLGQGLTAEERRVVKAFQERTSRMSDKQIREQLGMTQDKILEVSGIARVKLGVPVGGRFPDVPIPKAPVRKKAAKRFVSSKTVKEAEQIAIDKGAILSDYSGLSVEQANLVNRTLDVIPEKSVPDFIGNSRTYKDITGRKLGRRVKDFYGVSLSGSSWNFPLSVIERGADKAYKGLKTLGGRFTIVDETSGVWLSNGYKTIDSITAKKVAFNKSYKARHGKNWFFNATGETVPAHEFGHVYFKRTRLESKWTPISKRWFKESDLGSLSVPSESFAEAFASNFIDGGRRLPDYVKKFFRENVR